MDAIWQKMYDAAKAVKKARKVSDYVTCGEVAAAVLSKSGKIYTGICVDTCSTLGICAERSAIFAMLTAGEQEIDKVLAISPDGRSGAPCGACRELMVQLMPHTYQDIEIMMNMETGKTITLGEITLEYSVPYGTHNMHLVVSAYDIKTREVVGVQHSPLTVQVGIEEEMTDG